MATKHAEHGEVINLPAMDTGTISHAIVKTDQFETIRIALPAGESIPSHKVDGPLTVHCIRGKVNFSVQDEPREMTAGTWMFLNGGTPHAIEAREDSVLLVTILFS